MKSDMHGGIITDMFGYGTMDRNDTAVSVCLISVRFQQPAHNRKYRTYIGPAYRVQQLSFLSTLTLHLSDKRFQIDETLVVADSIVCKHFIQHPVGGSRRVLH